LAIYDTLSLFLESWLAPVLLLDVPPLDAVDAEVVLHLLVAVLLAALQVVVLGRWPLCLLSPTPWRRPFPLPPTLLPPLLRLLLLRRSQRFRLLR
jgi:hypothetical protein